MNHSMAVGANDSKISIWIKRRWPSSQRAEWSQMMCFDVSLAYLPVSLCEIKAAYLAPVTVNSLCVAS